jgi:hypothetical protein
MHGKRDRFESGVLVAAGGDCRALRTKGGIKMAGETAKVDTLFKVSQDRTLYLVAFSSLK